MGTMHPPSAVGSAQSGTLVSSASTKGADGPAAEPAVTFPRTVALWHALWSVGVVVRSPAARSGKGAARPAEKSICATLSRGSSALEPCSGFSGALPATGPKKTVETEVV